MSRKIYSYGSLTTLIAAAAFSCGVGQAQPLFDFSNVPAQSQIGPQYVLTEQNDATEDIGPDPRLQRQLVNYAGYEAPGTIIIDTPNTFLYYVLGHGKAIRYGIGVGREGFTWSGVRSIARKAEWPDWYPPPEMIARQPYLPRMTAGGPGNPLGARAMYLGGTEYRIHGTNDPTTIGKQVSSGCIRLTNEDVINLYDRVQIGAKVIVLAQAPPVLVAESPGQPRQVTAPLSASSPQAWPAEFSQRLSGSSKTR
jgi:lipoprotein-anchoring transpeptidase ErfK/SrfK